LSDNPRSATVRAKSAATLLEVSRESMRELIVREPRVLTLLMRFFRARLVGTLMATSPIFSRLDATERRELITQFRLRELPAAHEVLSQGQSGDGLYLVLAGELVVYRTPDAAGTAGGDKRVLGVLTSGDVFGEMSLLSGTAATAHVRAVDRAWVLRLPVEQFKGLAEAHPEVRAHLDEIAASRRAENRAPVALASVTPV